MLIVSWLARLSQSRSAVAPIATRAGRSDSSNFAADLLQCASSQAGQNPHQARELRDAAQAWLSVVR